MRVAGKAGSRSGLIRASRSPWMALALAMFTVAPARAAEITVESLTQNAVADLGPHFVDVDEAIKKFKARDLDGARALLEAAKKKTPKLAPPEIMLAQMYALSGQAQSVRGELEKAVRRYPLDPEAYVVLGEANFAEGRQTEASVLYEKAVALAAAFQENPRRQRHFLARAYSGAATVEDSQSRWEAMRDHLTAWIKIDPDNAGAHQRLGRALFQMGSQKEAYAELLASNKLDPKSTPAEIAMASLFGQLNDKPNAEKFLTAALNKSPQDVQIRLAAAQWRLQNNELDKAAQQAAEAVKLDPKSLEAKLARGIVARFSQDWKTAQTYLESAHLQAPLNFLAVNHLALTLVELQDETSRRRALEFAEAAVKANPNNLEAASTFGWVNYRLGRVAEAERALNAVVAANSSLTPESAYYVAFVMKDQNRAEDAVKLLEAVLAKDKSFAYRKDAQDLLAQLKQTRATPAKETAAPVRPRAGK